MKTADDARIADLRARARDLSTRVGRASLDTTYLDSDYNALRLEWKRAEAELAAAVAAIESMTGEIDWAAVKTATYG